MSICSFITASHHYYYFCQCNIHPNTIYMSTIYSWWIIQQYFQIFHFFSALFNCIAFSAWKILFLINVSAFVRFSVGHDKFVGMKIALRSFHSLNSHFYFYFFTFLLSSKSLSSQHFFSFIILFFIFNSVEAFLRANFLLLFYNKIMIMEIICVYCIYDS